MIQQAVPYAPFFSEQRALLQSVAKWIALGVVVGALCGAASAVFLLSLAWATDYREVHPLLLLALPVGGMIIAWGYDRFGKSVAAGNNLLLETIHEKAEEASPIPFRMAPLVLVGTLLTHFFGGSAGREGTAVQMGGTLASVAARLFRLGGRDTRVLLMAGISGGFGAVFGTPLAGTVFGLEMLSVGSLRYDALAGCFAAAYVGDVTCRALGVSHHHYTVGAVPELTPTVWLLILLAGVIFAGAAAIFAEGVHALTDFVKARVANPVVRPVLGGVAVIALTYLLGTREYLGLSLPLIEHAFHPGEIVLWAFALKLVFTVITLGTGYKGGEVTPLFCIGATLGAAFAAVTHQPVGFFAALGLVAVFAGAANTPLTCALLGIELFGSDIAIPVLAVCILSYTLSGHRGIYLSQRIGTPKAHGTGEAGSVLEDLRGMADDSKPSGV